MLEVEFIQLKERRKRIRGSTRRKKKWKIRRKLRMKEHRKTKSKRRENKDKQGKGKTTITDISLDAALLSSFFIPLFPSYLRIIFEWA